MMLPILISVSVAPVSYFFCASAPLQEAASTTRAAETAAGRRWNAGMLDLPRRVKCVTVLDRERLAARWGGIEYLSPAAIKKKPPATFVAGGFFFTSPRQG